MHGLAEVLRNLAQVTLLLQIQGVAKTPHQNRSTVVCLFTSLLGCIATASVTRPPYTLLRGISLDGEVLVLVDEVRLRT